MSRIIEKPTIIQAAGNLPKVIEEYVGRVNSGDLKLSIAHMKSPAGWKEPGQTPDFTEYTLVLKGVLKIENREATFRITAGQAFIAHPREWVRYSTPESEGAEYVAVCLPAFSPETVHRDN
jgi:hypothetical protein